MHHPDYQPTSNFLKIQFGESSLPLIDQPKISDLIKAKVANREYFYGLEMSAKSTNNTLDLGRFAILPVFTSLVWFNEYGDVESIGDVDSVRFGNSILGSSVVMPHFTCYRATEERVRDLLSLNFSNVLAVRGDCIDPNQSYQHACDLVADIRKIRGDSISIGVGGHPQKHPQAKSIEDDLRYLTKKVEAGADFIITQVCFDASSIVKFVGECRENGITVPIIVGVYIPEHYNVLLRMMEITRVKMEVNQLKEYEKRKENSTEFKEYASKAAEKFLAEIFESNIGVFGVHFYSMNYFDPIPDIVNNVIFKFNNNLDKT